MTITMLMSNTVKAAKLRRGVAAANESKSQPAATAR
jgi:hypothetical protein